MADFERRSDEELGALRALAERVAFELDRAGLPIITGSETRPAGGAELELDPGDDSAGGLYLHWRNAHLLADEVSEQLLGGRLSSPLIDHAGRIGSAMCEAMIKILESSGIGAGMSTDDLRPLSVRVHEGGHRPLG
ncbi:hypothetical protein SAMN05444920_12392 [Nonomuraea solani]|uniref:Uncharacterized protein n=1 Tax=Nonomuraea solani TaxID=1144553 RepID=A0A1H6EYK7_9ACTN|nr:hypothetical protein [Nonomuraea solani]SEH02036.1 hypothetical protein SAMN05444920_12392 [Nonomuraea solani]